jgi:hypothetical protein
MNKNYLRVPAEHFWILTKREKSQLLAELKRRVEVARLLETLEEEVRQAQVVEALEGEELEVQEHIVDNVEYAEI